MEREVDVLCRGFEAAYGRGAAQAAVAVWLDETAPAARAVLGAVVLRLQRAPVRPAWGAPSATGRATSP